MFHLSWYENSHTSRFTYRVSSPWWCVITPSRLKARLFRKPCNLYGKGFIKIGRPPIHIPKPFIGAIIPKTRITYSPNTTITITPIASYIPVQTPETTDRRSGIRGIVIYNGPIPPKIHCCIFWEWVINNNVKVMSDPLYPQVSHSESVNAIIRVTVNWSRSSDIYYYSVIAIIPVYFVSYFPIIKLWKFTSVGKNLYRCSPIFFIQIIMHGSKNYSVSFIFLSGIVTVIIVHKYSATTINNLAYIFWYSGYINTYSEV